jgi:chemotaxis protein MotB
MLFSMAKMDEPKYEKLKESVSKQFGGKYEAPPSPDAVAETMAKFVTQVLQEAGVEKETTVKYDALGVSVAFQSTVFFDTLSAEVKSQGHTVLGKLIDSIAREQQKSNKAYKIVIEGHTDSRPVLGGPFPSNWELSGARASRVVRMFLERGFAAEKLTSIGYADTRPELPSRTPSGTWDEPALAKNRRVVLRILEPGVDSIPFPTGVAPGAPASPGAPAAITVPGAIAVPASAPPAK